MADDEIAQLAELTTGVRNQADLEHEVAQQADKLLQEQAAEREQKRLDKTQKDRDRLSAQVIRLEKKLGESGNHATKQNIRAEVQHYKVQIEGYDNDLLQIKKRMDEQEKDAQEGNTTHEDAATKRQPGESQRGYLIRTGKITPFSKKGRQLLRTSSSLGDVLIDAEDQDEDINEELPEDEEAEEQTAGPTSHRNLLAPGFEQDETSDTSTNDSGARMARRPQDEEFASQYPAKRRRIGPGPSETASSTPEAPAPEQDQVDTSNTTPDTDADAKMARRLQDEEFASERPAKRRRLGTRKPARESSEAASGTPDSSDGAYVPEQTVQATQDEDEEEFSLDTAPSLKSKSGKGKKRKATQDAATQEDFAGIDDGNEAVYKKRLDSWVQRRSKARERHLAQHPTVDQPDSETNEVKSEEVEDAVENVPEHKEEWHLPHPTQTDTVFEGGLHIPGDIYPALFDYQKTGVQWLWELYSQGVGGIVGDEMGLGKTVQVISFLAGLHYSKKITKPIMIVCPATVMQQWVDEFHRWWPPLRVSILHSSGSGMLDVKREARNEDDLEALEYDQDKTVSKGAKAAKRIVDKVKRDGHVLVTTYSGLQTYSDLLVPTEWDYAVLDEGHKIRNPNTAITIFCKELRTHNRVILSGTPMQNNLTELWSLFDFVFPMRLGTLVDFRNSFEIPIKLGGYANASNLEVETAMKCAETLKDAISPYLLQRFKKDVAADLPKKSEEVVFCKLTKIQQEKYQGFLASEEMQSITDGKRQALYGVDQLRKICNHPDLADHKLRSKEPGYGNGAKSGKMQVVKGLLEMFKRTGHKTLLFAQHRIMLDILEKFVGGMEGMKFLRMDGNTSIKERQELVNKFNNDPDLHVFLLTTKVGGLGVNLTGADRVIIYDPDWNPATDVQARERAWRLGQKREVHIFRLMLGGTIEEKIYHRQLYKQFLAEKILHDPKKRTTFQLKDLHDLFSLGDSGEGQTETERVFEGSGLRNPGSKDSNGNEAEPSVEQGTDNLTSIAGVARQEVYRGNPDEEQGSSPSGDQAESEDRVLTGIFARAGVRSTVDADAIMRGNKRKARADPEIIGREAKRVATQAARDLQRAETVARSLPAGVPTWTGQYGTSGRPEERLPPTQRSRGGTRGGIRGGRGGGPSSASVLSNLQARQGESTSSSRASTPSSRGLGARRPAGRQPRGRDFIAMIRDYITSKGGTVRTEMLIQHFNPYCGSEQRTMEFSEMLKQIATKERGGRSGQSKWTLKEEYRNGV